MRKKLIEVALPLDAINAASAREKSTRHSRATIPPPRCVLCPSDAVLHFWSFPTQEAT